MADFSKISREERDAWLLSPATEAFLDTVARDLRRVNQAIVDHARSPETTTTERIAILGGYSQAFDSVLRLARGEGTRDVA